MAGAVHQEFTAERPPHIVFTPEVKRLAEKIVGEEENPLEKARADLSLGVEGDPLVFGDGIQHHCEPVGEGDRSP